MSKSATPVRVNPNSKLFKDKLWIHEPEQEPRDLRELRVKFEGSAKKATLQSVSQLSERVQQEPGSVTESEFVEGQHTSPNKKINV